MYEYKAKITNVVDGVDFNQVLLDKGLVVVIK